MAELDGSVNIGTAMDTTGIKQGVDQVVTELKKISTAANKEQKETEKSVGKTASAFAKAAAALVIAEKTIKTATKAIKETTEAYKTQAAAETQLSSAAKNNPYINGKGVSKLKEFASEVQSVTTYGDETLLPLISQLVATGRTESETMDIIRASVDLAASGTMSLESAVQSLNATYSGNAGTLGRQISSIKNLTDEELKQGKAVQIVAEQYKGMAENVAKTTGQGEQLTNAFGDLKETLGQGLMSTLAPLETSLTGIINKINDAIKKARQLKNWQKNIGETLSGNSDYDTTKLAKDQLSTQYQEQNQIINDLSTILNNGGVESNKKLYKQYKSLIDTYASIVGMGASNDDAIRAAIKDIQSQQSTRAEQIRTLNNLLQEMESASSPTEGGTESQTPEDRALSAQANYLKNIALLEETIKLKKQTGEITTEEEEKQELLNGKIEAYYQLREEAGSSMSDSNWFNQQVLSEISATDKEIQQIQDKNEKANALKETLASVSEKTTQSLSESLKDQLEQLDKALKEAQEAGVEIPEAELEDYKEKRILIEKEITAAMKDEAEERRNTIMEEINSTISQLESIQSNITDMATSNISAVQSTDLANAEKSYEDGAISYEEYCDKIDEINKQSAQKLYKVQLAEWAMQLASATANVAQGITKAYSEGYPLGIINGAILSVAGAAQIAQIVANKPTLNYATGGIVQGTSYTGDKVRANVNSGEMILNSAQQLALWKAANGGSTGGISQDIIINNSMSDKADVSASISDAQIRIAITEVVKSEFKKGTFNKSVVSASANNKGVKIL